MVTKIPFAVGTVVAGGLPMMPGPTKSEWSGFIIGLVALLARELVAIIQKRRGE